MMQMRNGVLTFGVFKFMGKYDVDVDELLLRLGDFGQKIKNSCWNGANTPLCGTQYKTMEINGFEITASHIFGSERGAVIDAEFDKQNPNYQPKSKEEKEEEQALKQGMIIMGKKAYYMKDGELIEFRFHDKNGNKISCKC